MEEAQHVDVEVLLGGREGAPPLRVVEAQPVALGHFAVCWGDVVEAQRALVSRICCISLSLSLVSMLFLQCLATHK